MRCTRCDRPIHEGDTGWYHQQPIEMDLGDGLTGTFNDRIIVCDDGQSHQPKQSRTHVIVYVPDLWAERPNCALCDEEIHPADHIRIGDGQVVHESHTTTGDK